MNEDVQPEAEEADDQAQASSTNAGATKSEEIPSAVQEIAELVRRLCVSYSNTAMYSLEHPVAEKSARDTFEWVDRLLKEKGLPVIISTVEGKILFEGLPVEEKNPLVSRLAKSLQAIHIDNLFFQPGLTVEEMIKFHEVFAQNSDIILEHGGIMAEFASAGISHIETKEATYVLISEDEKVVSKEARVLNANQVAGEAGKGGTDDELARYMVEEVLKKADQKSWLMNEIKNRPERMAQSIVEGIDLATSQAEMGIDAADDSIQALVSNIKQVGQSLLESGGERTEDAIDAEEAVMTLEKELRARTGSVTSNKVAGGFVNEILGVITSFSDQVRAQKVSQEFLQGEGSLKRAEGLLRNLSDGAEPSDELLMRLKDRIEKQGVDENDIDRLLEQLKQPEKEGAEPPPPKLDAEPRSQSNQTFEIDEESDLASELEKLGIPNEQETEEPPMEGVYELNRDVEVPELNSGVLISDQGLVDPGDARVSPLMDSAAGDPVARRDAILNASGYAVVVWDYRGRVEFISQQAAIFLGTDDAREIRKEFVLAIRDLKFPGAVAPSGYTGDNIRKAERALLASIEETVKDANGTVIGAFLGE